ncbi:MAG: glutaredoxin 3 [Solirubrobacteraceae bacterium]|jgi:glutaredoxin 3|nr:glutaredoxin 3 [Solirubrobacteraceae bacterium]MEA2139835.1 glutaredoxin 3 [Solirubrobacteraceae bacterium]
MRTVTIYDTELCTTCWSVQKLLEKRDIPYDHVVVVEDSDEHRKLSERTGMETLPQVFVGSVLLGGYEETAVAAEAGMLADLLVD